MPIYTSSGRSLLLTILCLTWLLCITILHLTVPPQVILLQNEVIHNEIDCAFRVPEIKSTSALWPFIKFQGDNLSFPEISRLILLEDGVPIGSPHALHDTIRARSNGNYSHWGKALFFSTTDCSNPRNNGRRYEVSVPASFPAWVVISTFVAAWIIAIQMLRYFSVRQNKLQTLLSSGRINYYFCASFLVIIISVLIKVPSLVTSAEFYAETATIFFKEAMDASFREILTYTWADYLVTFQLLVSFILVRVFGVIDNFPGTVNFLFLLFVAFSASLINLHMFRKLIAPDFLRFVIGLSIGLTPNFELYELLNSNLFGIMIFLLFIFVNKDSLNRWLFCFLVVLLFLTGISRPNMVAFLPVYIVLLGIAIRKNNIRDIIFYAGGSVSLVLQAYVMIMAQLYWSVRMNTNIYNDITGIESLYLPLGAAIYHYFRAMLTVVFFRQIDGFVPILLLILMVASVIIFACYYLYRKKRYSILYYFGLSQIIAFGMIYFITFSSPVPVDWNQFYYTPMRWWTYSNYVIYLSLMVLAYNTLQEMLSGSSIIAAKIMLYKPVIFTLSLTAFLFQVYPFYHYTDPYDGNNSLSNWEKYRFLMKEEDYYIPVNPAKSLQWGLGKDNRKLSASFQADGIVSGIHFSDTPADLKLRSIIIVNRAYYKSMKDLVVKAYDETGREMVSLRRLNNFEDKYLYYYFPERIRPHTLLFFNEKSQHVNIRPELHFFGKLGTNEPIVIRKI